MGNPFAGDASFAVRFANFYISKSYTAGAPPEAAALAADCHIILTRAQHMKFEIICIIDRDAEPEKRFSISPDAVREIGKKCLRYSGRVNFVRMPMYIQFIEIGRDAMTADAERMTALTRMPFLSRVRVSSWIVDTTALEIWSSEAHNGYLAGGRDMQCLLLQHFGHDPYQAQHMPAAAVPPFPHLSYTLIAIFVIIFLCEVIFAVDTPWKLQNPSVRTLVALGGLNWNLVVDSGEWYRILTATFLHGGFMHLVLNCVALGIAGPIIERLVGYAWFAAIYAVSAVCGSLVSLAVNPITIVSVGASGAIMGFLAATMVIGFHFPKGKIRTDLIGMSLVFLLPSLIPIATTRAGGPVDFGAHFGGALGGAIMGVLLLAIWPKTVAQPKFHMVGAAMAAMAFAYSAWAAGPVTKSYRAMQLSTALVPQDQLPKSNADAKTRAAGLVARYPRDPRAQYFHAIAMLEKKDLDGAERALRAAMAEEDILKTLLTPVMGARIRGALALVLFDKKQFAEAKNVAQPICGNAAIGEMGDILNKNRLCD